MRPGPRRTWSLLALTALVVALGAGMAHDPPALIGGNGAALSSGSHPAGALDAVLGTDAGRVESALGDRSAGASRLLVLLAALLIGIASPLRLVLVGRTVGPGELPSLTRLRHRVAPRAPPSLRIVALAH